MTLGLSTASLMQDLRMTAEFTTAVSAVIPVIILAAVLEGNVYGRRVAEAFAQDTTRWAAIEQEVGKYVNHRREVPVGLALRYKDALDSSRPTKAYGLIMMGWTVIVSGLSGIELIDLYFLARDAEDTAHPALVLANLIVIFLGFLLLIVLPFLAQAAAIFIEQAEDASSPTARLTRAQRRAVLEQATAARRRGR
ncbi:hypothetical protein [Streptomyces sp. NPDC049744]|uniref:hypothetical protein n=1 Tax=Streptomyces sp. NPDC049744 TaxID=3154359 RepID=UPI00342017B4